MTDRLDRIEAILESLAVKQTATAEQIERLASNVSAAIEESAADVVSMIGSLAQDVDVISANVNAYIAQSTASLAAEQRDRSEFRQQMIGLQTETRNILKELADLRKQGN